MSKVYPIHVAKAKFSEIIRLVKAGQRVLISERGRVVAEIGQALPEENESLQGRLSELKRKGNILQGKEVREIPHPIVSKPGALDRFLSSREP